MRSVSLDLIKSELCSVIEQLKPIKILLFGSQANEAASLNSDVDLLFIFPHISQKRPLMVSIARLLRKAPFAKDIVVMSEQEFEIDKYIIGSVAYPAFREGLILHEG